MHIFIYTTQTETKCLTTHAQKETIKKGLDLNVLMASHKGALYINIIRMLYV